jgi:hypothetical protein
MAEIRYFEGRGGGVPIVRKFPGFAHLAFCWEQHNIVDIKIASTAPLPRNDSRLSDQEIAPSRHKTFRLISVYSGQSTQATIIYDPL